jgi:hypothetical protein
MIKTIALVTIILFQASDAFNQNYKMREVNELINKEEPGWELVSEWIDEATNKLEILPKDSLKADSSLYKAQVTTRSPMGAIIYETGGILIDDGWIRILGSGHEKLNRNVMDWNKGKSYNKLGERLPFLLIADDVLGGFYAINAGGFDKKNIGKVFYFAPERLKWESMDMTYSQFIIFCLQGDLDGYYKGFRWTDWKKDVPNLDGNKGIHCFPFLWSKEGSDINTVSRKAVPIQELWDMYFKEKQKN